MQATFLGLPRVQVALAAALLFVMACMPAFADDFQLSVIGLVFLFASTGQAWNLMMGYAGQLSLGHSLYFGLGAYTMAILTQKLGINPWLGLPASAAVGAVLGALCGALGFRFAVRGVYFALLTIAFAELARILFEHWDYIGGTGGLFFSALPVGNNPLATLRGSAGFFYYALLATLACIWLLCALLVNSRIGYYWRAIREDEDAARALGVPAFRMKIAATAVSAAMTGVCGAWFALLQGSLFPDGVLGMRLSIDIIVAPIVGGLGTLFGPIIGAVVTVTLSEVSKELAQHFSINGLNFIFYGTLLLLIVLFAPHGIWPPLARLLKIGGKD
ncbi:branched-chain amino acid ABC transporter permease [soil metagenome]